MICPLNACAFLLLEAINAVLKVDSEKESLNASFALLLPLITLSIDSVLPCAFNFSSTYKSL